MELTLSQAVVWLRQQTPKSVFANFISKKFVANNIFCYVVSDPDFFRMPQEELVFLGEIHRTFVDRDLQKDSSSPFFRCFREI